MRRSMISTIKDANLNLFTHRNLDTIADYFTADYIAHPNMIGMIGMIGGHMAIRKALGLYHRAFDDIKVEVEILVKSRDRVAWQRTVRAIHQNAFKGFPGTGHPLVWRDMVTSRFEGCLIAEEWLLTDLAERLLLARKKKV